MFVKTDPDSYLLKGNHAFELHAKFNACDFKCHCRGKRFISVNRLPVQRACNGFLNFVLGANPDHLQELAQAQVKSFFVHGFFLEISVSRDFQPYCTPYLARLHIKSTLVPPLYLQRLYEAAGGLERKPKVRGGECVALVQVYSSASHTSSWRPGEKWSGGSSLVNGHKLCRTRGCKGAQKRARGLTNIPESGWDT